MATRWIDLLDPSREDVLSALPVHVDPEVVEVLASPADDGPIPRPLVEGHGAYVFAVLVPVLSLPAEDRVVYQEVDLVATPELLVTVRKTPASGAPFDPSALHPAADSGAPVGDLVYRLLDEAADSYLVALDAAYGEVEELEDSLDTWHSRRVRARVTELRHDFLRIRKTVAASRAAVRRILDGRVDVGERELFPPDVEARFGDTYETLQRATEDLDIARDLLAGARDHHQSRVAEENADIVKKLTVVASLVLVPSLIVGFYGQNFANAFDDGFWTLGTSLMLIVASTIAQLVFYRWRRWI